MLLGAFGVAQHCRRAHFALVANEMRKCAISSSPSPALRHKCAALNADMRHAISTQPHCAPYPRNVESPLSEHSQITDQRMSYGTGDLNLAPPRATPLVSLPTRPLSHLTDPSVVFSAPRPTYRRAHKMAENRTGRRSSPFVWPSFGDGHPGLHRLRTPIQAIVSTQTGLAPHKCPAHLQR